MSRIRSGGSVPLFDRLTVETNDFDGTSKNFLTPSGVEKSVINEINSLASTRSRLTFDEFLKNNLTVLDYGLPDFTGYSVQNDDHRNSIKASLIKAIEFYEPRLRNTKISIFQRPKEKNTFFFGVEAILVLGKEFQKVSFTLNNNYSTKIQKNLEEVI